MSGLRRPLLYAARPVAQPVGEFPAEQSQAARRQDVGVATKPG